jgi:hypothetical protein
VFSVRYGLNSYILFRIKSVVEGLNDILFKEVTVKM